MTSQRNSGSIVIYVRSGQPDAKALTEQFKVAQHAAEAAFGEFATVAYCDDGMAGSTTRRPALQTLLQHMDAGFVRAIVVVSTDRLTRSYMDDLRLRVRFQVAGVPLIIATGVSASLVGADEQAGPQVHDSEPTRTPAHQRWLSRALTGLRIKKY
ncbi:recombinase family protein [Lysobacter sp. CA199]|uniref:recombinase family protein n=1 Tax=Lysobacter sp. CA199 TaxID=3455608 RepID=UPI003F8D805E